MKNQVFISHAGKDESKVRVVVEYLKKHNLNPWFSPESLRVYDDWSAELPKVMDQCKVILLLWSKHCPESPYINNEVAMAINRKCGIVVFRWDETKLSGRFETFTGLNQFSTLLGVADTELEKVAQAVRGVLAQNGGAPCPFDLLSSEIESIDGEFAKSDRPMRGVRMLIRLATLFHAAKYLSTRDFCGEINKLVERLLLSQSLFVDLEVLVALESHLEKKRLPFHPEFSRFLQLGNTLPFAWSMLMNSGQTAEGFDTAQFYRLFRDQPLKPKALQAAATRYIKDALSQSWLDACQIWVSAIMEDHYGHAQNWNVTSMNDFAFLPAKSAATARIFLKSDYGEFPLEPFFTLIKPGNQNNWEIGMLLGEEKGSALYGPLTTGEVNPIQRQTIILPWKTMEARRKLPAEVFKR